jgi:hypothetical protein
MKPSPARNDPSTPSASWLTIAVPKNVSEPVGGGTARIRTFTYMDRRTNRICSAAVVAIATGAIIGTEQMYSGTSYALEQAGVYLIVCVVIFGYKYWAVRKGLGRQYKKSEWKMLAVLGGATVLACALQLSKQRTLGPLATVVGAFAAQIPLNIGEFLWRKSKIPMND